MQLPTSWRGAAGKLNIVIFFLGLCLFSCAQVGPISGLSSQQSYEGLKASCEEQERPLACRQLATVERDHDLRLSSHYYRRGCQLGDTLSCDELLRLSYFTRETQSDVAEFGRKCQHRHDYHCSLLSRYYQREGRVAEAQKTLELGCRGDDFQSCVGLMDIFGQNKNEEGFYETMERACLVASDKTWDDSDVRLREQGVKLCLLTGLRYFHQQDLDSSIYFYGRTCAMGPISGRGLEEKERLHQMLGCSRAAALAPDKFPKNWLDVSREYLRDRCELGHAEDAYDDCYDLAALESLLGRSGPSLHYLRRAFEKGFKSWEHLSEDPEMEFARSSPQFRPLMREYYGMSLRE